MQPLAFKLIPRSLKAVTTEVGITAAIMVDTTEDTIMAVITMADTITAITGATVGMAAGAVVGAVAGVVVVTTTTHPLITTTIHLVTT